MKYAKVLLSACLNVFSLMACSSTPSKSLQPLTVAPNIAPLISWKQDIAQMDSTFCHMQLTDMLGSVANQHHDTLAPPATFYSLRMELRQKLNEWIQKDSQLSVECQKLAFDIQVEWRKIEEKQFAKNPQEKPVEQKVFTNSQWQLFSNPFLMEGELVTSVSELKNGDVVVADEKLSVISKNENDEMRSWFPDTPGRWVQLSMHHSMGWLKQPAKRVVVLRHWNPDTADQLVRWVRAQQNDRRIEQREPSSSAWTELASFLKTSQELPLEANPNFLQVFEWRNHSYLQSEH